MYNPKRIIELLRNLQTSEWENNVLSKPKLRHFKSYKTTFTFQNENVLCFPNLG